MLPALLRKFHEAKAQGKDAVEIWGTGSPRREFLHVDDFADACLFLMGQYEEETWINVGSNEEVTIADLASMIAKAVGYSGSLTLNRSMPDGMSRKLLDSTRLRRLGWTPKIDLASGIAGTYRWLMEHLGEFRD